MYNIRAEIDKKFLLDLFHQAFNADAETLLRYHISLQEHKLPPSKFRRLEADLINIHNAIANFYKDAGLDEYVLNKKSKRR
ncbi:MAG: hypothetical protein QW478_03090 [Candidatus Micrarchaeaceae archaeon]